MRILTIIALAIIIATGAATARVQRGIRRGQVRPEAVEAVADSVAPGPTAVAAADTAIARAGYDKPLRSNYETIFMTNRLGEAVEAVRLTVTYMDIQGRTLHRRSVWVRVPMEPGATRMGRWRSWDVQQSFYYHRSAPPRRAPGTPYRITTEVDSVMLSCVN